LFGDIIYVLIDYIVGINSVLCNMNNSGLFKRK